jgi:hypothetical protein
MSYDFSLQTFLGDLGGTDLSFWFESCDSLGHLV